ncbi:DUF624 domain-containing protein [Salibacterium salarium]|uniref:DUF624 domain-containing protein n=1 Tax=Salibacterium salarium TaxID=284579 RepID=A0A428NA91_9BACI|nr:YesL family protein [Salibacterium salarium]RSL35322.1 DUF624 domain-containing protein [Salibacterium salarium]
MESGLYKISHWIMRLAHLNLLWILFTFIGLVAAGIFPSTTAMFTIVRDWVRGEHDKPIFSTFWATYKKEFSRSNLLGSIVLIIGIILYVDYFYFLNMQGAIGTAMSILFITTAVLYLMLVSFLFPVLAHYDFKTIDYIKYSFIVGASYPLHTFYIVLSVGVVLYATVVFPVILVFFSGSFLSLLIMRFAYTAFEKIDKKITAN